MDDLDGYKYNILKVGDRLDVDAYSCDGLLLLPEGRPIQNEHQLIRLQQPDVIFMRGGWKKPRVQLAGRIAIDNFTRSLSRDNAPEPGQPSDDSIKRAASVKTEIIEDVVELFDKVESDGDLDLTLAHNTASLLAHEMMEDSLAMSALSRLKNADAYTFTHCVNVSILAMNIALKMSAAFDDIVNVGIGALLHDIGKISVPRAILTKPSVLSDTEFHIIRRHPDYGAGILQRSGYKNRIGLSCVLDHHERISGTGYPRGKSGSGIDRYARIAGIADIYDALTTDRPYRNALAPMDALKVMNEKMVGDLDIEILRSFLETVISIAAVDIAGVQKERENKDRTNAPAEETEPKIIPHTRFEALA